MNIEVPDDLYALNLAIQDKIALATMRQRPRIGNGALAKLLGVGNSGVMSMIRRLKSLGLLKVLKPDGSREFVVKVDQGAHLRELQKVTRTGSVEMLQIVNPAPPTDWTPEQRGFWWGQHFKKRFDHIYGNLVRGNHPGMCTHYATEFTKLADEISACSELPEEPKQLLLEVVEHQRNHQAAGEFINQHITGDEVEHAWLRLGKAKPDQLATFFEQIQRGQLGGGSEQLLVRARQEWAQDRTIADEGTLPTSVYKIPEVEIQKPRSLT